MGAINISRIQPLLKENGISLVGIGLEEIGAEEFIQEKFLAGEVYVDLKKKCYRDLGFKRFNWLNIFKALFSSTSRKAIAQAKKMNIEGDLSGDGLQNGGLIVVKKGGKKLLLFHREDVPGEHVTNEMILDVLGISVKASDRAHFLENSSEQLLIEEDLDLKSTGSITGLPPPEAGIY